MQLFNKDYCTVNWHNVPKWYCMVFFIAYTFSIDHWDNERERLLILTKNCMLIYKYDFIIHKMEDFKRVMLHLIDTICIGDFVYPPKSLMP